MSAAIVLEGVITKVSVKPIQTGLTQLLWSPAGFRVAVLMMLVLASIVRIHGLNAEVFWFDEIVSIKGVSPPTIGGVISRAARDDQTPPLYYLLLRAWRVFSKDPVWARAFSVVAGLLCVAVTGLLAFWVGGRSLCLLTLFLMALSQYQVYYSQEARLYTLLALACVGSVSSLVWALKEPSAKRRWLLYAGVTLFGVYLHYPFWFSAVLHPIWVLFTFIRNRAIGRFAWKAVGLAWLVIALLSLPMVYLLMMQFETHEISWIPPLSASNLFYTAKSMTCGIFVSLPRWATEAGIVVSLVCWIGFALSGRWERPWNGAVLVFGFLPIVLIVLVSLFRPMLYFGQRYAIVAQPFLVLALAGGCLALPRWLGVPSVFVIVFIWGLMMDRMYEQVEKRRYDIAASVITRESRLGDRVIVVPDYSYECLVFFDRGIPPALPCPSGNCDQELGRVINTGNRVWVVAITDKKTRPESAMAGYAERTRSFQVPTGPYLRVELYEKRH